MTISPEKLRLADFFHGEYTRLLGYVRRRVDHIAAQEAEDFVHDVVVKLFDKADASRPIEYLSAYVYRALQNRIVDYFRRSNRRPIERDSEAERVPQQISDTVEDGDVLRDIRRMEMAHDLQCLMVQLTDAEKEVILATEIQGHTAADLSLQWNEPLNTLLSRKNRAMKKIQRFVQQEQ